MEQQLQEKNIQGVWRSLKTISGFKAPPAQTEGDLLWVNNLNSHFLRFDQSPSPPPTQLPALPSPAGQWGTPAPLHTSASALQPPNTHGLTHPPSLSFSTAQVRLELKKIRPRKAAGPDGISSRLLKSCADELCGVMEHVFNMSLKLRVVPQLWKTSCVVPVPKMLQAKELSSFRPVALTSHLMKTLERLVFGHLRSTVSSAMDPLQLAYRPGIRVEDAVIYLLQRSLSHLENPGSTVRILFFDFSSAFNTIQPLLLRDKLETAGVDCDLADWILDYLTNRPQFVRAKNCVSDLRTCNVGAPQGTVLTLYTANFRHNTDSCVLQKFSDDCGVQRTSTGLCGLVSAEPPDHQCREDQGDGGGLPQTPLYCPLSEHSGKGH
ncbi:hypothetical protein NQD34_007862 [Periophthalmus magnuspinnatus]|nr:hypothetical protein NQD34_007862 [Periophthalmus magnuspinnatus]